MFRKKLLSIMATTMITLGGNVIFNSIPVYANPPEIDIQSNQNTELRADELENKIQQYDNSIENIMDRLNKLNSRIRDKEQELIQAEKDVIVAQEEYEIAEERYMENMKLLYINGGHNQKFISYIDAILSSKNVTDVITKMDTIKRMYNHENEIIEDLEEKKTILEKNTEKIASDKEQLKTDKDAVQKELKDMESKKQSLVKLLEEQRRASIKMLAVSSQKPIPISAEASEKAKGILNKAQSYLGVPYVWGGTSPSGFDCSGFVQYVFGNEGISLPRVSQSQQGVGVTVPKQYANPGDLVFFGSPAYHVGIYMGDGKYIHAPQTGDVIKIANLNWGSVSNVKRVIN